MHAVMGFKNKKLQPIEIPTIVDDQATTSIASIGNCEQESNDVTCFYPERERCDGISPNMM